MERDVQSDRRYVWHGEIFFPTDLYPAQIKFRKIHKVMGRMGYQSKEEAAVSISKGYIFDAHVNSRDFAYAAEGFGPPKHSELGTAIEIHVDLPCWDYRL